MGWENVVKSQLQIASVVGGKWITRWLNAKSLAYTGQSGTYTANQLANDVVRGWSETLDFWLGPLSPVFGGNPLIPFLYIAISAGTVTIDHDPVPANVTFTACSELGGTHVIPALDGSGNPNIRFQVVDSRNIVVNGITTAPNTQGLYAGLVMEGPTPIANVIVKL